jgi:hypothetical protein
MFLILGPGFEMKCGLDGLVIGECHHQPIEGFWLEVLDLPFALNDKTYGYRLDTAGT